MAWAEISIEDFCGIETYAGRKVKLLIVCSTWGDGEQPDNAQELYDTVSELEVRCLVCPSPFSRSGTPRSRW